MKRLAPLLLALALAPGSFAENPQTVKPRVGVKTFQSDQAFLESQRRAAVPPAEAQPSPAEPQDSPSDLPDPTAAPIASEAPRVAPKAQAAPRVAKSDRYYDADPYTAPRIRTQQQIVLGDPIFEDTDTFRDESLPYVINRDRRYRYEDDDDAIRFSVKNEVHRKVSHIRHFIHRLLPF